jgi:hypothetical protein
LWSANNGSDDIFDQVIAWNDTQLSLSDVTNSSRWYVKMLSAWMSKLSS